MLGSEFGDEYGDWLSGTRSVHRQNWLSQTLGEMRHKPVVHVDPASTIEAVIETMNRHHESAVLVMDRDRLLGIFTERDVLVRVVPKIDGLFMTVAELMTPDPQVLTPATLLSVALRELAVGGYHHLPVVDEDQIPVALVSLQTIIAYLAETFPNEILNAPPERESFPPERHGA
jgi:CBS domain-containing protein